MKRLMLVGLLGGMLASSTGCCLLQDACCCRPCGGRGGCDQGLCSDACDDGCCPTCGAMRASDPCIRVFSAASRRLGRWLRWLRCRVRPALPEGVWPQLRPDLRLLRRFWRLRRPLCRSVRRRLLRGCWYRGPLSCLFALFGRGFWCGPNCGERYWGDFYGDPPDCEDPCDCHGNYAGGCRSCGGGYHDGAVYHDGGTYNESGGCKNCGRSAGHGRLWPRLTMASRWPTRTSSRKTIG